MTAEVQRALTTERLEFDDVVTSVTGDRIHVEITSSRIEQLAAHVDVIADALEVADVDSQTVGSTLHVWAIEASQKVATRQVGLWVPLAVRDAVREQGSRSGDTYTTIVLSAFNRQAGSDGSGLRALFPEANEAAVGPMTIPTRKRRTDAPTLVQLWTYLDPNQELVLDRAVAETGAGSRSALVSQILAADLDVDVQA